MQKIKTSFLALILIPLAVSACARDLSSNVYTSDATLSLTLEGVVKSVRPIVIKNSDELSRNSTGIISGGALGGAAAANAGKGNGQMLAIVGGVVAGAALGALMESELGKQDGFEYIVKVDTSKLKDGYYEGSGAMRKAISSATTNGLVTIIQGKDVLLAKNEPVFVIFSDKRTRIISAK